MFEIAQVESFNHDLGNAPKPVRNAMKAVYAALRDHPKVPEPPRIKKLTGWKGLWRYRVKDSYRLVYRIDFDSKKPTITLLMLGDRQSVYDRLGSADDGSPGVRIIAGAFDDLLEREPTPAEVGEALMEMAADDAAEMSGPDEPLPVELTPALLSSCGVPEGYQQFLAGVKTEAELLGAVDRVPAAIVERVINAIWPAPIEEVIQEAVRIVPDEEAMIDVAESVGDLVQFLLKLDEEQETFVSRFKRPDPEGPWLLKGGPGSGKSVVALYCIKALMDSEAEKLPGQSRSLKILLTTYTNALTNTARQLMSSIASQNGHSIRVDTVDKVVRDFLPSQTKALKTPKSSDLEDLARKAIEKCVHETPGFTFTSSDANYLLDEVEWVITGQDLGSLDEYLTKADRKRRGRPLGRKQREHVWLFHEKFHEELRRQHLTTWVDRQLTALKDAKTTYDYVFIDEAQDLKPVAVRFLLRLAKQPENLFLTADSNQSIYGTGMSWARIAEDVKFSGKAQILKRNYRTTKEIWDAVKQLAPEAEDTETLSVEAVFSGPPPVLSKHRTQHAFEERLNEFLFAALRKERLAVDSAAVLCPINRLLDEVVAVMDPAFNARAFPSQEVDITHRGVKVLTIHAAKGLEFPVVAIVGANDGLLPLRPRPGDDPEDHRSRQHRLLFVAATRAMRQLIILADARRPSPFLGSATDNFWEIEEVG